MCKSIITLSMLETINEKPCSEIRGDLVRIISKVDAWAWLLKEENPKCTACLSYIGYDGKNYCVKDIDYSKKK